MDSLPASDRDAAFARDLALWRQRGLHVLCKPIGPRCNLRCRYCFYLEKESLYPDESSWRMSPETLEAFIRQYVTAQPPRVREITFAFQGGEPTLMGLDFFRLAVELQKKYVPASMRVHNTLQTNGLLLDDAWCRFLGENGFLVGLSIDGPPEMHDAFRVNLRGEGTFAQVDAALDRLRLHKTPFNALVCVHRANAERGREVYRFLRGRGVRHIQFIPIVVPTAAAAATVRRFAPTSELDIDRLPEAAEHIDGCPVLDFSVTPEQYGRFLIDVFEQWLADRDVGRVFVRDFDQALSTWVGRGADLCVYSPECGRALALEHNGDLYSCDHFVDQEHRLGNIHDTPLREMANSPAQYRFGRAKRTTLPGRCRTCDVLHLCRGGCPKDRIVCTAEGEGGLNYLCEGYRSFFRHTAPMFRRMAEAIRSGQPADSVLRSLRNDRSQPGDGAVPARNAPCPCGSGKKYKHCCGKRPRRPS
ncbi:anaerobic sulfatase maturase [Thermostilla marina]